MTVRGATVLQGGRAKAYRPLPDHQRREALAAGLAAYERGDFFEAHELLEPAWMGTADPVERDLLQGLIKVAAAFVHDVRGNSPGVAKNLAGARVRLVAARRGGRQGNGDRAGNGGGQLDTGRPSDAIDVAALITAIDDRLAALTADPTASVEPPTIRRSAT